MIVESADDFSIFTVDLDGKITTWNSGAERIFGYNEEEANGQDISLIFTHEDKDEDIPQKEIDDALTKGRALDQRWHVRKDGTHFWADGILMPLQDRWGSTHGFLKIIRDRTEYHYLQEALHAKEEELKRLKEELLAKVVSKAVGKKIQVQA